MFMKFAVKISLVLLLSLLLAGCLTPEFKQYYFKVEADGSGVGYIEFINLLSDEKEDESRILTDFNMLINDYLRGTEFEDKNRNYEVIEKKLYEKNGALNGIVHFKFDDYQTIGFYHYQDDANSLIFYYCDELMEKPVEANGQFPRGDDPIIYWPAGSTEFSFKTVVTEDTSVSSSLLELFHVWEKTNK